MLYIYLLIFRLAGIKINCGAYHYSLSCSVKSKLKSEPNPTTIFLLIKTQGLVALIIEIMLLKLCE